MNSIKYDLYTTDDAVTPVAVDIVSGYQHNMAGDETTKTFYVKSYNVLGDNIDSNQDDGNALAPLLMITWDTQSADTVVTISGSPMEYTNDGGVTWDDIIPGSRSLPSGVGPYELRETAALGAVTKCAFDNTTSSNYFDGNMTVIGGINLINCEKMFADFTNIINLDLTSMNTSNVTNMSLMFNKIGLPTLNLSSFDTSKVTNMISMFSVSPVLTHLDLTNFDFSNVLDTSRFLMNSGAIVCITNIDTIASADKSFMFTSCTALIQPDTTAQADLTDTDGANWVNANPCP